MSSVIIGTIPLPSGFVGSDSPRATALGHCLNQQNPLARGLFLKQNCWISVLKKGDVNPGTVRRVWIRCFGYILFSVLFLKDTQIVQEHVEDEVIMPFENENHFCGEKVENVKKLEQSFVKEYSTFFQEFGWQNYNFERDTCKVSDFFSVLVYIKRTAE